MGHESGGVEAAYKGHVFREAGKRREVARLAGLEPAAPGSEAQCSIH